jgi:hypothetical protein
MDALRKQAKRWLRALRAGDAEARARLERAHPAAPPQPVLRDVQHALAREYGYESWLHLKRAHEETAHAAAQAADTPEAYDRMVGDLLLAFNEQDAAALARLNAIRGTSFTYDDVAALIWGRVYAYRQRRNRGAEPYLLPDEARTLVAQNAGYASWEALTAPKESRPARVPAYEIDAHENQISPRRDMNDAEWGEFIDAIIQRRITTVDAGGQITDARLAQLARLDHVTTLRLNGARMLTDGGLGELARMPQLQQLELNQYPGGRFTDEGLAVLRHLPSLRVFSMSWQRNVTDAGVRHLEACPALERVDVMGSNTGDALIAAMAGKASLRTLHTGRLVTDAGLARLRDIPQFVVPPATTEAGADLLIDGPFSNSGFAHVATLAGVAKLDLFWHVTGITSAAFAHLSRLPHLATLGADGRLSDDEAMGHFAAMPGLRSLRAQESVATDGGFEALSRSATLAEFWGRTCPHFGSRGFIAFSRMPSLRTLGIGCENVDDAALSRLPAFPSLRELTPIGVRDDGFRHVGGCERLERLTCMYCRDTTDAATAHVTGLPLKYYYAGLTQITDRSLQLLGGMDTLEQIEFYECLQITDSGLPALAALPRLREVSVSGSPRVTHTGMRAFPAHVRARYST